MQVFVGTDLGLKLGHCWPNTRSFSSTVHAKVRLRFAGLGVSHMRDRLDSMSCVAKGSSGYITPDGMYTEDCSCAMKGACSDPECEGLHKSVEDQLEEQDFEQPADGHAKLIISAGPERSGSTWLFNAIRLLFKHAKCPLDSYWMHNITDAKLNIRGVGKRNVLIKTHDWSDDWDTKSATHILITHRDLRDVIASYERMGWRFGPLPNSYVSEHLQWKDICDLDIACEDLSPHGTAQLARVAETLGLTSKINIEEVDKVLKLELTSGSYKHGGPHPVTKVWPGHLRSSVLKSSQGLENDTGEESVERTKKLPLDSTTKDLEEYNSIYGYS